MNQPVIQLVIETASGTFIRSVRPATVLPEGAPGYAAEDATRNAAAYWGLPDFVYRSGRQSRGSAVREIGDALVVVGPMAAAIQVKAREALTSSETKERSWLDKQIRQAASQARGTIKSVTSVDELTLINERGTPIAIKGPEKTWLAVVVLDHPGVAGYVPSEDAVVLLRRDWEFLFEQLKSTYAVLEYLRRVAGEDRVPLGEEPIRYYRLAAADAATSPSAPDPRIAHIGRAWAAPLLPQAPAGHGDRYHSLVRAVLEDVATARLPDDVTVENMVEVLAAIDAVPIAHRAELGRLWLSWLEEVAKTPEGEVSWRSRNLIGGGRPYLIFVAAPRHNAVVQSAFGAYVRLRHQQHLEFLPERNALLTVGILLTPRADQYGPWDTTVMATRGDQGFTDEERRSLEDFWGKMGESVVRA